ncbi:MAG: hypothetical protein L6Q40_09050, partial [Azonexus sp.]|nr:hypothetical protein [Azonexus sp.]
MLPIQFRRHVAALVQIGMNLTAVTNHERGTFTATQIQFEAYPCASIQQCRRGTNQTSRRSHASRAETSFTQAFGWRAGST